jgi:hypothetical protein
MRKVNTLLFVAIFVFSMFLSACGNGGNAPAEGDSGGGRPRNDRGRR